VRVPVELRELGFHAQTARGDAKRDGASVVILHGRVSRLDERLGRPLTIGALEVCDLTVVGKGVSRDHAKLHCHAKRWVLEDNSFNGTLIRRLGGLRPWRIHHARLDLQHKDSFRCGAGPWVLFENYDQAGTVRVAPEGDLAGVASLHDLTAREAEVASTYVARWFDGEDSSNAALAQALFISVETIKTHIASIRSKWGCRAREDIARCAVEAGLLPIRLPGEAGGT
jgi:DNA-binding CsgD family transcriptional regulator